MINSKQRTLLFQELKEKYDALSYYEYHDDETAFSLEYIVQGILSAMKIVGVLSESYALRYSTNNGFSYISEDGYKLLFTPYKDFNGHKDGMLIR